jgi:membrane-bound metal-dependent hydrolase YbcI (DUF457 family)
MSWHLVTAFQLALAALLELNNSPLRFERSTACILGGVFLRMFFWVFACLACQRLWAFVQKGIGKRNICH